MHSCLFIVNVWKERKRNKIFNSIQNSTLILTCLWMSKWELTKSLMWTVVVLYSMFMFWAFNIVQISLLSYYRPQTKFAKVVFLHVSVILSTGGGLPQCMLGYHPPGAGTTPPRADTPQEQAPPGAVYAGRYGQQAGGTHPTGMHSCFTIWSISCQLSDLHS